MRFENLFENLLEIQVALRMLPTLANAPPAHVKASLEPVIEEATVI